MQLTRIQVTDYSRPRGRKNAPMKSQSKAIKIFVVYLVPIALVLILLLWPARVRAATFTVNSTDDTDDTNPGDSVCIAGCDTCTLRAAITEANALAGADTIDFDPDVFSVPKTIALGRPLQTISNELIIKGPGETTLTLDANGTGSVLFIQNDAKITISDLSMTGGRAGSSGGGGIYTSARSTLTLNNVTVRGNTAPKYNENGIEKQGIGGGIYNAGSLIILNNSTVSGNTANQGGGIFKQLGTAILNRSTVSGNTATGRSDSSGGGITNYRGTLTLNNSTISVNSASFGGGIAAAGGDAAITLNNCTVAFNSAQFDGSSGLRVTGGTVTLKNTIMANNGGNCNFPSGYSLISRGHNLSTDLSCRFIGTGDINGMPARLAPLSLNPPGSTKTHDLLAGSLAIDGIPLADCTDASGNSITIDQRGVPRPRGTACDLGAVELTKAGAIDGLINTIATMGLPNGVANKLRSLLGEASTLLNDNNPSNDITACGKLNEFIYTISTNLQDGRLTSAQANQLFQAADAIMTSLGC
jgi:CSLREA domain-containing protein